MRCWIFGLLVWLSWTATTYAQADPQIVGISDGITLSPGDTVVLVCITVGDTSGGITWTRNDQTLTNSSLVTISEDPGFTVAGRVFRQSVVQICSAGYSDAGTYACIIRSGTITAVTALIELTIPGVHNAQVAAISENVIAAQGATVVHSCVGYGLPTADITWTFNGEAIVNSSLVSISEQELIGGGLLLKQSFLQICSVRFTDSGTYTCTVSNGVASSANASTQLALAGAETVGLIMMSNDTTVDLGETILLSCVGYATPSGPITWMRNGQILTNSSLVSIYEGSVMIFRQSFLEICSAGSADAGTYTCTITSPRLYIYASTEVTVFGRETATLAVLSNGTTVSEGETVIFTCLGFGIPDIEINWRLNDEMVSNSSLVTVYDEYYPQGIGLVRESTLEVCSARIADSGEYTCSVSAGVFSEDATLQLDLFGSENIRLAAISNDSYVIAGQTVVLSCVGWALPAVDVTWAFNGQPIVNSSLISTSEEVFTQVGRQFKQSFLQICNVGMGSPAGEYTCTVTNNMLTVEATTQLILSDLSLMAISEDTTMAERETAVLMCMGYSTDADVSITWSLDGQPLGNSGLVTITEAILQGGLLYRQSFLQLCSVSIAQSGAYTCTVDNGQVSLQATTLLNITGFGEAEVLAISNHTTLFQGETVTLICLGYGEPYLEMTWIRNGQTVVNSSLVTISEEEFLLPGRVIRQSFLQICSVGIEDTGEYICSVNNSVISVSESTRLALVGGDDIEFVAISDHTFLFEGDTALLSCIGYGQPSLDITWLRNNQPVLNSSLITISEGVLPGSGRPFLQSFLQICAISTVESGDYTCNINNTLVSIDATTQLTVPYVEVSAISSDTTISMGETVFVTCVGSGQPGNVSISWTHYGQPVLSSSLVTIYQENFVLRGRQYIQSTIQICSFNFSVAGDYMCIVSNDQLSANASVQLPLFGIENVNHVAISDNAIVGEGDTVVLMCIGFGQPNIGQPNVGVTWTRGGQPIASSPLINITEDQFFQVGKLFRQSFLQLCSVAETDFGAYTCAVSDNMVTIEASTELTVIGPGRAELVAISSHSTVTEGQTVLLSCVGYGKPQAEFTWSFNGENVTNSTFVRVFEDQEGRIFGQSFLEICGVGMSDSGAYTCTVSNGEFTASAATQLTVAGAELVNLVVISDDATVFEGETALLTCVGFGDPDVLISWIFNGQTVVNSSLIFVYEEVFYQAGKFFTQSYLQICSDNLADAGTYTCSVSNGLISVNASTRLIFAGAVNVGLVATSNDTALSVGDTPVLSCIGYGQPSLSITWTHEGQELVNSSIVIITEMDLSEGGIFRQSFLHICGIAIGDFGSYTCVVSNGAVSVDADILLTIEGAGEFQLAAISDHTSLAEGETTILTCVGYGEPDVEITWIRNDQTLTNSTFVSVFEDNSFQGGRLFKQSYLQLCSVEMADAGSYMCVVSIGHQDVSYSVDLTVTEATGIQASLLVPPLLQVSLNEGDSAMFLCRAQGLPLPDVIWFKDGTLIIQLGTKYQINSGRNLDNDGTPTRSSILTVSQLSPRDAGTYNCRASNNISSATLPMPYILTVIPVTINYCTPNPCQNGGSCTSGQTSFECRCTQGYTGITCDTEAQAPSPPVLMTAPQNMIVPLLDQATFVCVATGNPQPAVQWFKDGRPISGEISPMLVIGEVSLSDRGLYHCTATNSEGSVTSSPALLNVQGIYQYTVPVMLPLSASGPFPVGEIPSDEVVTAISNLVGDLNDAAVNVDVGTDPVFLISGLDTVGNVTTISSTPSMGVFRVGILATLFDRDGSSMPPDRAVLDAVAELIERLARERLQIPDLNVQAGNIQRFDGCPMETEVVARGNLTWLGGILGETSRSRCPCDLVPVPRHAARVCGGDFITGGRWMASNTSACEFDALSFELCDARSMIEVASLSADTERMRALGIIIITLNVEQNLQDAAASNFILDVIDNVQKVSLGEVKKSHDEFNSTSRIRVALETLMESYPISSTPQPVIRDTFGCSLYPSLDNMALSFSPSLGDIIELGGADSSPAASSNLTITLPQTLAVDAGLTTQPSLAFCGYKTAALFVRRDSYLQASDRDNLQVASGVVSARLAATEKITDLTENIQMRFVKNQEGAGTKCSFWDQSLDGGYGGWSEEGCRLIKENADDVNCECDHLTNFAILSDGSLGGEVNIQVFTIIGVAVAFVCVVMVLTSIIISSKIRSTALGVFLINLCIALLCLYISYTISHFVGNSEGACRFFSFLFHYLILVSSLGFTLLAVFSGGIPSMESGSDGWTPCSGRKNLLLYLTGIIINWVFPLVVVIICIAAGVNNYSPPNTTHFCRPVSGAYWYGLLLIGGMFILLTIVLLIIAPIRHAKSSNVVQKKISQSDNWFTDFIGLVVISILFFVGWGFGIPATHPLNLGVTRVILQAIFITCNILQGLVMVLCYCQKVWRAYSFNENFTRAEDNAYGMTSQDNDGLIFENPLSESVTDVSLPDYDAVNFEYDSKEKTSYLDDADQAGISGDRDEIKEDLMETFDSNYDI